MSEVEKVVKKWSKDELIAFIAECVQVDPGRLEQWRYEREWKVAQAEIDNLDHRAQAALRRGDMSGFEQIERLRRAARIRERSAFKAMLDRVLAADEAAARERKRDEYRRARPTSEPPSRPTSRELALVGPTRASDPEVVDAELVEDDPLALPKPRLGLPAPRRSLPMQQRRK